MKNITNYIKHYKHLTILHLTVFIWGFTGLLGALITIPATHLVWYRVLIGFVSIIAYNLFTKTPTKITGTTFIKLITTGGILGLHWILFFYSIKISNVSVTLISLSSITLFTSIIEPLISRRRISKLEVFTGFNIIIGIGLIFKFEGDYKLGLLTGLLSAICASLFTIINSKLVKEIAPTVISFYELLGSWIWLSCYLISINDTSIFRLISINDLLYLLILGIICTAMAYVAGVAVMKKIPVFQVALITNLEPIYGIILAYLFIGKKEEMSLGFYTGSLIILSSIIGFSYYKKRNKN